jgi:hypothetical protein
MRPPATSRLSVVSGSLLRPVGGWLSDRIGGYRLLLVVLAAVAVCLMSVATLPSLRSSSLRCLSRSDCWAWATARAPARAATPAGRTALSPAQWPPAGSAVLSADDERSDEGCHGHRATLGLSIVAIAFQAYHHTVGACARWSLWWQPAVVKQSAFSAIAASSVAV